MLLANAGIFTSLWLNAHLTADADLGNIVKPLFIRAVGPASASCRSPSSRWLAFTVAAPGRHRPVHLTANWRLDRHRLDEHHARRESKRAFTFITATSTLMSAVVADQASLLEHGPGRACSILRTPPWPS